MQNFDKSAGRENDESGKPDGLRARQKLATRQMISNTATRLFMERGFDRVTIDEVAAALVAAFREYDQTP